MLQRTLDFMRSDYTLRVKQPMSMTLLLV